MGSFLTLYYRLIWRISVLVLGEQATWHQALRESDSMLCLGLATGTGGGA